MAAITADVAIIGGGLMGCFTAHFLRGQDRRVAIIEKGRLCAAASAVNFGNLRVQGRDPSEFPLSLRAQAIWEDLARITGEDCGVDPSGHVYLGFGERDLPSLEKAAREGRVAGLDTELIDGNEARRRLPLLSGRVVGASWSRRDAVADPAIASPAVARLATRSGANVLEGTAVRTIKAAPGGFVLTLEGGREVHCGEVVNAAGAWAGEIARQVGETVPMFAAGPPLFMLAAEGRYDGPSLHAVDGTLLLRRNRSGDAVAGAFPRVRADTATGEALVTLDRVERGLARLGEIVPGLGRLRAGRAWSGVEGYLADMLPVIGWSGTTPGLFHAFGFSGHGYQLAPGVGAVVAEMLTEGRSATPIERFSMARFAGGFVPDEKLWSEFDPELVATFRQAQGGAKRG